MILKLLKRPAKPFKLRFRQGGSKGGRPLTLPSVIRTFYGHPRTPRWRRCPAPVVIHPCPLGTHLRYAGTRWRRRVCHADAWHAGRRVRCVLQGNCGRDRPKHGHRRFSDHGQRRLRQFRRATCVEHGRCRASRCRHVLRQTGRPPRTRTVSARLRRCKATMRHLRRVSVGVAQQ